MGGTQLKPYPVHRHTQQQQQLRLAATIRVHAACYLLIRRVRGGSDDHHHPKRKRKIVRPVMDEIHVRYEGTSLPSYYPVQGPPSLDPSPKLTRAAVTATTTPPTGSCYEESCYPDTRSPPVCPNRCFIVGPPPPLRSRCIT